MSFFPINPTQYRPSKILFQIEVLREIDRAVQEGLGGYTNRHELVNDMVEQGLIGLRYPDGEAPLPPQALSDAEAKAAARSNGSGNSVEVRAAAEKSAETMPEVNPIGDLSETHIESPPTLGAVVRNELARIPDEPMFGMHNRDAPTAWALARLASEAADGPIHLSRFYEAITEEAWRLAAQLAPFEAKGNMKLAVMMPRNPEKPQSATQGFRAFALGQVARKPDDDGKLVAWGPFYQWGAVGIVDDVKDPKIGLTESGWKLVQVFEGLDFSLPHNDKIALRFLSHLEKHAPADRWGFRTALDGAAERLGRIGMSEYFLQRLTTDFSDTEWKDSVADSVASGYVSRARAWGLVEPKLLDRKYALTVAGENAVRKFSATPKSV